MLHWDCQIGVTADWFVAGVCKSFCDCTQLGCLTYKHMHAHVDSALDRDPNSVLALITDKILSHAVWSQTWQISRITD